MEKSDKPAPEKFDEGAVARRDDVQVHGAGGLRCPFCHDAVDIDAAAAWVACEKCLARHHGACWSEGGRCGGCGHEVALAGCMRTTPPRPAAGATRAFRTVLVAAAIVVLTIMVGGFVVFSRLRSRAFSEQVALAKAERARRVEVVDGYAVVDRRGDWMFVSMDAMGRAGCVVAGLGTRFDRADGSTVLCQTPEGVQVVFNKDQLRSGSDLFIRHGEQNDYVRLTPELRDALVAALAAPPSEVDIKALLAKFGGR